MHPSRSNGLRCAPALFFVAVFSACSQQPQGFGQTSVDISAMNDLKVIAAYKGPGGTILFTDNAASATKPDVRTARLFFQPERGHADNVYQISNNGTANVATKINDPEYPVGFAISFGDVPDAKTGVFVFAQSADGNGSSKLRVYCGEDLRYMAEYDRASAELTKQIQKTFRENPADIRSLSGVPGRNITPCPSPS